MTTGFGTRLRRAMDHHGPLCVGIDPQRRLLEAWGLPYDVTGLERFALTCVEAFAGAVAAVKPQSAFFAVFGSRGSGVQERGLADLLWASTLTILDAKRGDIGSTMAGYAAAYLGPEAVSPPDALTVSPYLGYESLRPAIDVAQQHGRGLFVLALTSNPDGASVQHAVLGGRSVAASIVEGATVDNSLARERGELGDIGLVVGATVGDAVDRLGLDLVTAATPVLAPGFGAQGGTVADLDLVFGAARPQVLVASSRAVLGAGPDVVGLADAARRVADGLRA
ncbi:MAG: orotidine-5'-phosphate decarboxylase [Intrasporangium sp.]|uniref:orotidine-5'-phosphate decarboxylase n=1 Tax=Intrasporangium sp. TaxID=1925024 RepID=UPI00264896B6|nr:orotidine-5'-phosphate decarboxylase [Intrasporangium sp.]MDN5794148.1 orotidine-5'-phosphate decarboxylase [Intrasporangium sp.]